MSDFESRVRAALAASARGAPSAEGLAGGARTRLRRRRRRTAVAVSVVAAAAVVAAIPVGLSLTRGSGGPGGTDGPPIASEPPDGSGDGWRTESWATLEFEVPDSWGHGSPTQWCINPGGKDQGLVSRPNEVSTMVACEPQSGYGATIGLPPVLAPGIGSGDVWQYDADAADIPEYHDGAWLSIVVQEDLAVTVAGPDRATTRRIADSVHRISGTDSNGCAPRAAVPAVGEMPPSDPPDSGPLVTCEYLGDVEGANLAASATLDTETAAAVLAALDQAAAGGGTPVVYGECAAVDPPGTLLLRGGVPLAWVFDTACSDSAVDRGGEVIPLTTELVAALNPDAAGGGGGSTPDEGTGTGTVPGTLAPDTPVSNGR